MFLKIVQTSYPRKRWHRIAVLKVVDYIIDKGEKRIKFISMFQLYIFLYGRVHIWNIGCFFFFFNIGSVQAGRSWKRHLVFLCYVASVDRGLVSCVNSYFDAYLIVVFVINCSTVVMVVVNCSTAVMVVVDCSTVILILING